MATKITVVLEDDLEGGPADETVRFGIGDSQYEIDLSKKNAAAFRRQLAPFIDHARKTGQAQRRRPGRTAASRERSGGIRAWAKEAGHRAQRRRPHPRQRRRAVPSRRQRTLTHTPGPWPGQIPPRSPWP